MAGRVSAERDPDWRQYPDTILRFHSNPPVTIDLRAPLSGQDHLALQAIGLNGPFAVMTAFDPLGRNLSRSENSARASALESRLAARSESYVAVDACSPDGGHCEASVALRTDLETAGAVASEFEQMAFFWYDGRMFWIIGALATTDPTPLPMS